MPSQNQDQCQCRIIHEDRVKKAGASALPANEVEKTTQLFKAMGDATRLKMLWAMADEEICVCDLAANLEITESAVSHQLRHLRTIGLVANRRQGPVLYYRLADDHVSELIFTALEHVRE
ncbi:MAG: winged helix-turn-helix transcriptional regulator [Desulfobulbaceae bacterium]|nr:winged helix-turn-helix transcriptional regulator [Desulfobulbaceae bacterium]MCK5340433.1 winged helix-turn-helix transcriptional regulator [Desulfobulbaceae bacterium]MCK5404272.1 winged helix-turn-helix transcriptional regulator [Desulfobulbaceae bacterium]